LSLGPSTKLLGLDLETDGVAPPAGLLELAALGTHVRFDAVVGVRIGDRGAVAEVLKSLAILGTPKENRAASGWGRQCQLVECEALAA